VIVLSVMGGFETDLRDKILGSNAHIQITKPDGPFTEYREVAAALAEVPAVVAHSPYLHTEVVISARNNYANVIIKGVDPETVGEVTDLAKNLDDPEGLAKLWPLNEDGSIAGPPPARRVAPPARDGAAPPASGRDAIDPVPEDLAIDIEDPVDFSAPQPARGATELDGAEPPSGEGTRPPADRAPDDLSVDVDEPMDFSGRGEHAEPRPMPGSGPGWDPLDPMADYEDLAAGGFGIGDPLARPLGGLDLDVLGDPRRISPEIARLPGVLVGRELVKQVAMIEGDEVTIVSPLGQDSPVGPVPRTKRYRVAGEFFTGMYEYDLKYVYVTLSSLQDFLDLDDEVSGIEVRIHNPDRSGAVLPQIAAVIGDDYAVTDWRELNRSLFSALKLEKIAMFLVLAIIILVASFSIVGNLVMVVIEKAKEIALLKTLGATDGGVMKVFVVQGFFIGLVGTALGVSLGLITCALGIAYGLPLDPDVYYIDQLPIDVEAGSVIAVGLAGILISVLATLYPAHVAARLRPVEGMRYE
jgi:lipoprotein-releasing system permease protein